MSLYKTVRAIISVDYVIPMHDDKISKLDGRNLLEIQKEWFIDFDINRFHATRDGHKLGGGMTVLQTMVVEEE